MRPTLALLALLTLVACGDGPDELVPYAVEPRFPDIQDKVLTPACTGGACHDADHPQADLDLTFGAAYPELISGTSAAGHPYVVPKDPANSLLVRKLRGALGVTEGEPMPMGSEPLDEPVIHAIEQWILDGASRD